MIILSIKEHLEPRAKDRPPGYIDEIKAVGSVNGDSIELSEEAYLQLLEKYRWIDSRSRFARLSKATSAWVGSGMPLCDKIDAESRKSICMKCSLYDSAAYFGIGKCNHPSCGCSGIKRMMKTEKCPEGKW